MRLFNLLAGPFIFYIFAYILPVSAFGSFGANAAVGAVAWMAYWWITAPVDFAVTAFLPIIINSIFNIVKMESLIANYFSEIIILLLGASILSVAWEETKLDRRIALFVLSLFGSSLRTQIILWFIIACALSSVLPNAVVAASLTPIAISMLRFIGIDDIGSNRPASLILLTIVYAAGVGGLATPLSGAMNLVTVNYIEELSKTEYFYTDWIVKFAPIMLVLIVSNIAFLAFICKKGDVLGKSKEYFKNEYKNLAKMSTAEMYSLGLF